MSLKNSIDNLKFDSRMVEINLKNQTLNVEEHKKFLDKLPDVKSSAIPLDLESNSDYDSLNDHENNFLVAKTFTQVKIYIKITSISNNTNKMATKKYLIENGTRAFP